MSTDAEHIIEILGANPEGLTTAKLQRYRETVKKLINGGFVSVQDGVYRLTAKGETQYKRLHEVAYQRFLNEYGVEITDARTGEVIMTEMSLAQFMQWMEKGKG